jgi:hypothetical protein
LAAAHALKGDIDEAKTALAEARRLNPKLSVKWLVERKPVLQPAFEGLRKAGLARMVERVGVEAKLTFKAHPHMLRHACGFALANKGHDTRALQAFSTVPWRPILAKRIPPRRSIRRPAAIAGSRAPAEIDLLLGHDDRHRPLPQLLPLPMQRHAFHVRHVTLSHTAVTRYRRPCNALLGRRTVARLDHPGRVVVEPVGRAPHAPHHDLLLDPHDFERFAGQDHKRMVQTRRIDANPAVADEIDALLVGIAMNPVTRRAVLDAFEGNGLLAYTEPEPEFAAHELGRLRKTRVNKALENFDENIRSRVISVLEQLHAIA